MNFYPFHIGDYAAHTRNLSLLEDLAYRRLLDAYYLAESPLNGSATDVAREIGMREHAADVEYVLGRFFVRDGDTWRQPRADIVIEHYQAKQEKASRAGKASAAKRASASSTDVEKDGNGRSTNQEPITNNQSKDSPLPPKGEASRQPGPQPNPAPASAKAQKPDPKQGFAEFWIKYPRKTAKQDAEKAWAKLKPDADLQATLLTALDQQTRSPDWAKDGGKYIPHPATWLNGRRWEDEIAQELPSRHHGFDQRDYAAGLTQREDGTYGF